jgi:hypothetical protein
MDLVEIALEALLGDEEICPGVVLAQSTPHRLSFQIIYNYGERNPTPAGCPPHVAKGNWNCRWEGKKR